MNTVRKNADLYTEAATILHRAKSERKEALLHEGAALLDSHEFNGLAEHQQRRLSELYAEACFAVSGIMA